MAQPSVPSPNSSDMQTAAVADIGAPFDSIIDQATPTVQYVCEALAGTPSSTAKWRVTRITVAGNVTTTRLAQGTDGVYGSFTVKADDRTTLTYAS